MNKLSCHNGMKMEGKEVGRIKKLVSEMVVDNNITDQETINNLIRD